VLIETLRDIFVVELRSSRFAKHTVGEFAIFWCKNTQQSIVIPVPTLYQVKELTADSIDFIIKKLVDPVELLASHMLV